MEARGRGRAGLRVRGGGRGGVRVRGGRMRGRGRAGGRGRGQRRVLSNEMKCYQPWFDDERREAGQRVQPSLSRFTVASVTRTLTP